MLPLVVHQNGREELGCSRWSFTRINGGEELGCSRWSFTRIYRSTHHVYTYGAYPTRSYRTCTSHVRVYEPYEATAR